MGKFDGKRLLMLGTSTGSVAIVRYAKSEGAYVIVTDYLPVERSEAKRYADESAMISTTDVDALCCFASEKNIDGVFCGVSEVNLRSVYQIATRLGLPCYFTQEQWDMTEDKAMFKALCQKYHVPVAGKYEISRIPTEQELSAIRYPVIVKPVDSSSCIGIHVCYDRQALLAGIEDAYHNSVKGQIIVEDYIIGDEFTAYYNIVNGECRLSAMGDKYLNKEQQGLTPLPEAFLFPSRHLNVFLRDVDSHVRDMIAGIGMKNGLIFIQGITDGENFAVFEAGLRINGSEMHMIVDQINGFNMMHLLVEYALTGQMHGDLNLEDPHFSGKCACYLYLVNRGGRIAEIRGLEEVENMDGVLDIRLYRVGQTIQPSGTLGQRTLRLCLLCDTAQQLKQTIEQVQKTVAVLDEDGNDMLLTGFNTEKVLRWQEDRNKGNL